MQMPSCVMKLRTASNKHLKEDAGGEDAGEAGAEEAADDGGVGGRRRQHV